MAFRERLRDESLPNFSFEFTREQWERLRLRILYAIQTRRKDDETAF